MNKGSPVSGTLETCFQFPAPTQAFNIRDEFLRVHNFHALATPIIETLKLTSPIECLAPSVSFLRYPAETCTCVPFGNESSQLRSNGEFRPLYLIFNSLPDESEATLSANCSRAA